MTDLTDRMKAKPVCMVCGKPGTRNHPPGSLCFGVHANCAGGNIKVKEALPVVFKVTNTQNKKVWWCTDSGMRVIEKPEGLEQWLRRIGKLEFRG